MQIRTHSDKRHALLVKLAKTTKAMRTAQKSYFATRSNQALNESRALERETDKCLADLDMLENLMAGDPRDQAQLFN